MICSSSGVAGVRGRSARRSGFDLEISGKSDLDGPDAAVSRDRKCRLLLTSVSGETR